MMNKEERSEYDKELIERMTEALSYSLPFSDKDLKQVFYQGQMTMLHKLSNMLVGHNTGVGFIGVITEIQLKELEKEIEDDSTKTDSK